MSDNNIYQDFLDRCAFYSQSNFFKSKSRAPTQSLSSNNCQPSRETPPLSTSNSRTMVPGQFSSQHLQSAGQIVPPSSHLSRTSLMVPGYVSQQTPPLSSSISNTRSMVPGQNSSQQITPSSGLINKHSTVPGQFSYSNARQTAPTSSHLSNVSSMVPGQFSSANARQTTPPSSHPSNLSSMVPGQFSTSNARQTAPPSSHLSNPRSIVPGQFSSANARQTTPPSSHPSNLSSMVPGQFSSSNARQTTPPSSHLSSLSSKVPGQFFSSNARQTAPPFSALSNFTSMVSGQFSTANARQTAPPSSHLSNPRSIVPGQYLSPIYLQNARQAAPPPSSLSNRSSIMPRHFCKETTAPSPCLSKRATGGALGDDKSMLGTSWAPIEIPDSPSREKSPCQHDGSRRAKRAREEKSEVENCSDTVSKIKKAKVMRQSQNQIIKRPKHGSELPSIQIDSDSANRLAAYLQFVEKELLLEELPATTMVQETVNDFFNGLSVDDFISMERFKCGGKF